MARVLMILAVCGVLGCNRSAEVPSGPDQDWQALLKSQEEEIHRLEAENSKLRAECREGAPLTDAEDPLPEPAVEASSTPPIAAQQQHRPTVSRFSVTSPLSAGGRAQLVWKARIENTSGEAEKVAALFEAFDENGVSLAQWGEESTIPAAQTQDLAKQRIVSSLTQPAKVVLTLRSRWGDSRATAMVLDTSPLEPTEAPLRAGGESRLTVLLSPRVKYTLPEEVGVEFTVWNPSHDKPLSRTVTLRLLKNGSVVDQKEIYIEDLPPQAERGYGETFRNPGGAGFTAELVL